MRLPDPNKPLAWNCAGDVIVTDGIGGARPITLEQASGRHLFHCLALLKTASATLAGERTEGALAFHMAWERDLRLAIAARADHRRASGPFQHRRAA